MGGQVAKLHRIHLIPAATRRQTFVLLSSLLPNKPVVQRKVTYLRFPSDSGLMCLSQGTDMVTGGRREGRIPDQSEQRGEWV